MMMMMIRPGETCLTITGCLRLLNVLSCLDEPAKAEPETMKRFNVTVSELFEY